MRKNILIILSFFILFQLVGCTNNSSIEIDKNESISKQFKEYRESQNNRTKKKEDNIQSDKNKNDTTINKVENVANNVKEHASNMINENVLNKAYEILDEDMKKSITDLSKTKIEEFKTSETKIIVGYNSMTEDLKDRETYKVTFVSSEDDIKGPIIVYLDKNKIDPIGREMRI